MVYQQKIADWVDKNGTYLYHELCTNIYSIELNKIYIGTANNNIKFLQIQPDCG